MQRPVVVEIPLAPFDARDFFAPKSHAFRHIGERHDNLLDLLRAPQRLKFSRRYRSGAAARVQLIRGHRRRLPCLKKASGSSTCTPATVVATLACIIGVMIVA